MRKVLSRLIASRIAVGVASALLAVLTIGLVGEVREWTHDDHAISLQYLLVAVGIAGGGIAFWYSATTRDLLVHARRDTQRQVMPYLMGMIHARSKLIDWRLRVSDGLDLKMLDFDDVQRELINEMFEHNVLKHPLSYAGIVVNPSTSYAYLIGMVLYDKPRNRFFLASTKKTYIAPGGGDYFLFGDPISRDELCRDIHLTYRFNFNPIADLAPQSDMSASVVIGTASDGNVYFWVREFLSVKGGVLRTMTGVYCINPATRRPERVYRQESPESLLS